MKTCCASLLMLLLTVLANPAFAAEPGGKAEKADPAATQLLAEARAARALWQDFPGFSADVEVNLDGQVTASRVEVSELALLPLRR